jgi:acyl carrier protein
VDAVLEPRVEATRERVIRILDEMTRDWDHDYLGPIASSTRLIGDLGFESMDLVILIVNVEHVFLRKGLPFEHLFVVNGGVIKDVTVEQVVTFVTRCLTPVGAAAV